MYSIHAENIDTIYFGMQCRLNSYCLGFEMSLFFGGMQRLVVFIRPFGNKSPSVVRLLGIIPIRLPVSR